MNKKQYPDWVGRLSYDLEEKLNQLSGKAERAFCELGVTHWNSIVISVGNSLKKSGFTQDEIREIFTVSAKAYKDDVSSRDIELALSKVYNNTSSRRKSQPWPELNKNKIDELCKHSSCNSFDQLKEDYPLEETEPQKILSKLFNDDDLICLAATRKDKFGGEIMTCKEWQTEPTKGKNYITPSCMVGKMGKTDDGKNSARCNNNVKNRRYLIIEFDGLAHSTQIVLLTHLAEIAPLTMVLNTGGKSLHSWFDCKSESEEDLRFFMEYAVSLGADKMMWTQSQLCRLPGGKHEKTNNAHEVILFRPSESQIEKWNFEKLRNLYERVSTSSTPPPYEGMHFIPEKVFYASETGAYFVEIGNNYRQYSRKTAVKSGVERYLRFKGFDYNEAKDMIPLIFNQIEIDQAVDWTGALAGFKRGMMTYKGRSFLITSGPNIPEPIIGTAPLINSVIEQAFPSKDSRDFFMGWLATGVKAILAQRHQAAPMLVLAAEPNAGKTLLAYIVKLIFGGRCANPMTSWTGKLPWNDDLLGSELLLIDDSVGSTHPRARKEFGSRFKEAIYAGEITINTRRKSSISFRPVWRVMVCCNETAENLSVIPPLEEGIEDKIALLKVKKVIPPMPTTTAHEEEAFSKALEQEIPAFLNTLLEFQIPEHLGDTRTGIIAWKDQELLDAIEAISPEKSLESLISLAIKKESLLSENSEKWFSATELTQELKKYHSACATQARDLLSYAPNCGSYLSRLIKKDSPFVTKSKTVNGTAQYLITQPEGFEVELCSFFDTDEVE